MENSKLMRSAAIKDLVTEEVDASDLNHWVDPEKDKQATMQDIQNGLRTRAQVIREQEFETLFQTEEFQDWIAKKLFIPIESQDLILFKS